MQEYINKNELRHIKLSDIRKELPDLKNSKSSKVNTICEWICDWIKSELSVGSIKENDCIPSKAELAYMFGVSMGTVQNALRQAEDLGYLASKQCIGTLVRDYKKPSNSMRKLTSKRDIVIEDIKKYILQNGFKKGDILPSSRKIANAVSSSQNTTRLALECLGLFGVITRDNEQNWIVQTTDIEVSEDCSNETLVAKIYEDLKNYISSNLKTGDRMPAHDELCKMFHVSLKTVHDALKMLIDEDIIVARRGRYGTTVTRMPDRSSVGEKYETSIFAPAKDAVFYHYEKTQNVIKKMIADEYKIGMKLPSIAKLSQQLDLSPNTVRKALHNMAKEGYLAFSRGRYGGTYVIDVPEIQSFKWIAVSPEYSKVSEMEN